MYCGSEPASPPEYEILVRLLGDIRVEGGAKKLHPKPTAVLALRSPGARP